MTARKVFLFFILFCIALMMVGVYLEYFKNIHPCILCLLQRYSVILIGFFSILAFLQNPKIIGQRIYAIFIFLFSVFGLAAASRQIWLEHQPQTQTISCLPDPSYLLTHLPLMRAITVMLQGSSDCGQIQWVFLSFSLADWSFFAFLVLAVLALVILFFARQFKIKGDAWIQK